MTFGISSNESRGVADRGTSDDGVEDTRCHPTATWNAVADTRGHPTATLPLRIRGAIRHVSHVECRWGYARIRAEKNATMSFPTHQTCQSFEFLLWELGYKGRRSIRYTSDYILDATTTGSSPKRFRKITHLVAFSWGHGIPVGKSKMLANIIEDICAVEVRWKLGPFFFQWQASLSFFWAF